MTILLKRNSKALKKLVWRRKMNYENEGGLEAASLSGYRFLPQK
jgi:hypothetical protein